MRHTHFKKILSSHGITPADLAAHGLSYGTVLSHYYGTREMSLKAAKRYGSILKIPFWVLLTIFGTKGKILVFCISSEGVRRNKDYFDPWKQAPDIVLSSGIE